jgi:hypothetical protein
LVEFNAGNPISVCVLFNCEFALSNSVPNLQVLISSSTGNLSVIWWESNWKNISAVTNESLNCDSFSQIPKSKSSIPRSGKAISAVLWKTQVT